MNDFTLIAKILAIIKATEDKQGFDTAVLDEKVLKSTPIHRDNLVLKLKDAGYIDGIYVIDGVYNSDRRIILWEKSKPVITLAGMEYMEECKPLKKAITELKSSGVVGAAATLFSGINLL